MKKLIVIFLFFSIFFSAVAINPIDQKMENNKKKYNSEAVVYGYIPYWINNYNIEWNALTHIAYFAAPMNETGELTGIVNIENFINVRNSAHANKRKITITITSFDSDAIDSILAYYKQTATESITEIIDKYSIDGVSIDFEGIRETNVYTGESNKEYIKTFLQLLRNSIGNRHISMCLADYYMSVFFDSAIGNNLDAIIIMGYNYHYSGSSTTGAIAPFDSIKATTEKILQYYSSSKVILALPLYGYDWPTTSDSKGAETLGKGTAVFQKYAWGNAIKYGRRFDAQSKSPWYAYQENAQWHQCWFDDDISLSIKFDYITESKLQGVGFWAVGYESNEASLWNIVKGKFFYGYSPLSGKIICIDPGHGGSDPGAVGIDGSFFPNEKDFNLDIGIRVKELLSMAGATVVMTRKIDEDVSLSKRCEIANNANSDIFLSIHMNSHTSESAQGTITFYWAESQTEYSVNGKSLAEKLQAKVVEKLQTYDRGAVGDKPYLGYHLYVLNNVNMPASLVEVLFISNQQEFDIINAPDNRTKAALAIYEGICDYFSVKPVYGITEITGYPSPFSSVTRTVFFKKKYINESMITYAYWKLDNKFMGTIVNKEWYFDDYSFDRIVLNTYAYSFGWHSITIYLKDLWDNNIKIVNDLFFQRSPSAYAKAYGSPSAQALLDDDDETYGANDLNLPIYIEFPCNISIEYIKTHLWDGDDRYYQYKIEVSKDNLTWEMVVNKTFGEWRSWQFDTIKKNARWIRFTGVNNSANKWWHVLELQIFSTPFSFVLYGPLSQQKKATISILNEKNSNKKNIETEDGYFEYNLNELNTTYGDDIVIYSGSDTKEFKVKDPEVWKNIKLNITSLKINAENISVYSGDVMNFSVYVHDRSASVSGANISCFASIGNVSSYVWHTNETGFWSGKYHAPKVNETTIDKITIKANAIGFVEGIKQINVFINAMNIMNITINAPTTTFPGENINISIFAEAFGIGLKDVIIHIEEFNITSITNNNGYAIVNITIPEANNITLHIYASKEGFKPVLSIINITIIYGKVEIELYSEKEVYCGEDFNVTIKVSRGSKPLFGIMVEIKFQSIAAVAYTNQSGICSFVLHAPVFDVLQNLSIFAIIYTKPTSYAMKEITVLLRKLDVDIELPKEIDGGKTFKISLYAKSNGKYVRDCEVLINFSSMVLPKT
ncbi:MAG: N-acetylmuramoyl-L-alanine amidase, partial [Candidatus Thermoplasmatota archaeon]